MRALCAYLIYIPMGILVLQCFGLFWIYQIPIRQNKARKTSFVNMSYIYPHPKDIYPRRELNTAKLSLPQGHDSFCVAKILQILHIRKHSGIFFEKSDLSHLLGIGLLLGACSRIVVLYPDKQGLQSLFQKMSAVLSICPAICERIFGGTLFMLYK